MPGAKSINVSKTKTISNRMASKEALLTHAVATTREFSMWTVLRVGALQITDLLVHQE